MKYLGILLLIGFITLAVFGTLGMHLGAQDHGGGCVASIVAGADCPKQGSLLSYLNFHLNAYKDFSLAILSGGLNMLVFMLGALAILGFYLLLPYLFRPPKLVLSKYRFRDSFSPPQKQKLTRWLALHEQSPNRV